MNNFYKTFRFNKLLRPLMVLVILLFALTVKVNAQSSLSPYCYGADIQLFACPANGLDGSGNTFNFCNAPGAYYSWSNYDGSWTSTDENPVISLGVDDGAYHAGVFYLSIYVPGVGPGTGTFNGYTTVNLVAQINQEPVTVDNGGYRCYGDAGVHVKVTNIQSGVQYQLEWWDGVDWDLVGSYLTGTAGSTLDFGAQTVDGLYKVVGKRVGSLCYQDMANTITIQEPSGPLAATVTSTNVSCNGGSDGTITISSPTGGYGTYNYSINGGTTWQASGSFTGLTSTTYNVQIQDAAHTYCVVILNGALAITQPNVLSASVASTNVTCNGANDGTITISSPTGGYGTYNYSIDGGTTWQASGSYTGLANATYNVQIQDAAHPSCVITLNGALVITQPNALAATATSTNVTCNGAGDGTITISNVSGGYGTYDYSIHTGNHWIAGLSNTNLAPGTYYVKIRDAAHTSCIYNVATINITQPDPLSATATSTNVTCNGAGDGTVTINNVSGGYGTYNYSIDGGTTWGASTNNTGLIPGTYNVEIRDAAHTACVFDINTFNITQPNILSASVASTNVTCNGANDGTISITSPTGGYGNYNYSIDGGATWQANGIYTGLANATYSVQIQDAAYPACVITLNGALVISQPSVLAATATSTNITCNGAGDGTITISNISGGYGTYNYSIDGGATWGASTNNTGLIPGTYNVKIRDAAHIACVLNINTFNITQPNILSASVASTNVTCNGANDGTITITNPTGGYGTYNYSIDGGISWQTSGSYTGLANATYNVQIQDAAYPSCTITLNEALVISQPNVLSASIASTNVTCNGANDGTITITSPTGGWGTYNYSIDNGATWQASGNFTGLANATYNVQIQDAAHTACVVTLNGALVITQPIVLSASVASTNVTCNGGNDGTITITNPTGGYGTYNYRLNNGAWQSSGNFTGVANGTYNVQIQDAAYPTCVVSLNGALVITQPNVLSATVVPTNVTCHGANDGTITITSPTGGYGTYNYSIDGGASWQASGSYTGLANATYNIKIQDAAYPTCIITLNGALVISQPNVLSASVASRNVTCNGGSDGTITISSPTGGYGTYQYSINGGTTWQASGSFTGLSSATYNILIRDAAHTACFVTLNAALLLSQPSGLTATIASTNVSCNGANDGTITITSPSGGYGTYQYSDNGGTSWQTSGSYTSLANATYNVQIRDAAHTACAITLNNALVITQPAVLSASVASTNVTCHGANDGTISITSPTGGYGTYNYSINGGTTWQPSGIFTGVANGTYNVKIQDAAHTSCIITLNGALVISQPNVLSASVASTNVTCNGANDGTISITSPTGGYGTYNYSIDGGISWQASGSYTGLTNATYDVQIQDAAHTACIITLNGELVITQPNTLSAIVNSTNVTCNGANDGTITISSPTGGYGTYKYSINGGTSWQSSGSFTGLTNTTYNIQIQDAAHTACIITLNGAYTITQPNVLSASVASTNVTCHGANDGTITITSPTGGYGTYNYRLNNGAWQSSGNFTGLANATYSVQIQDAAHTACIITLNGALVITQPNVLSASVTSTNVTCNGANDGTITITSPTGGYGTYQYSINGGTSWQPSGSFTGLANATYSVKIQDAAYPACIITLNNTLVITQPNVLSASIASTNVTCNGANDGTITLTSPTGGYGTYKYSINGGTSWQSSGSFTGLTNTTYNIQIQDAAHTACIITLNGAYSITQPGVLSATVASTNVSCNGANNGTITITNPTGGWGTYKYSINGGTSWQASGNFTGLANGTYNVQIQDAAHSACIITLNGALVISQPIQVTVSGTPTNVTCNGYTNGSISVTNSTGSTVVITDDIGNDVTANNGSYAAGIYTLTATAPDGNNIGVCTATTTVTITQPDQLFAFSFPPVIPSCATLTNISVEVITFGGTPGYFINGNPATGDDFVTVPVGVPYTIHVTDANGCSWDIPGEVDIPGILQATATVNHDIYCNGGTTTVTLTATGGTPPYFDEMNNEFNPSIQRTVYAGPYQFTITDGLGCTTTASVDPLQPNAITATLSHTDIVCNGANNGSITVSNAQGGYNSPTYEYSFDNGQTWQSSNIINGLLPGTYQVWIMDADNDHNCSVYIGSQTISQPYPLSATVTSTDVTCNGANNGTITITSPAGGGSGTYNYSIDGGASWQSSGSFTGLVSATYNVQIQDAAHPVCSIITLNGELTINQPDVLSASVASTNVTCNGANDGTITITNPTGGYGTYNYRLNNGVWQASGSFTGLANATYSVQIQDAAYPACIITLNNALVITQPNVLSASVVSTNVTCNGANDGTITITNPTGGYGTYNYRLNSGAWQTSGSFTGLPNGTYSVQIQDALYPACIVTLNGALVITQPNVLNASVTSTNVTCNGANNGTITITSPTGGYGTYKYSINGGTTWQSSGNFTGLSNATYDVQIQDAAHTSCIVTLNAALVITQPNVLSASIGSQTNNTCYNYSTGSVTVNATGGTLAYQYSIDNITFSTNNTISGLAAGNYTVYVKDAHSCTTTVPVTITQPAQWAPVVIDTLQTPSHVACQNSTGNIYTVSGNYSHVGSTYQWVVTGGTITSGANTKTVTITWGSVTPGSLVVKETLASGCFNSSTPYNVVINPLPTPSITGSTAVTANQSGYVYSTASTGNLFSWTVLGGTITSGQGTPSITVTWGATGTGTITVFETNPSTGCIGTNTLSVTINSGTQTLSGVVSYFNDYSTPLSGVTIQLVNNGTVIATTTTGAGIVSGNPVMGYYEFDNVLYGTYTLNVSSTKPWGGVNATDALLVQLNLGGGSLTSLDLTAADVNASNTINATDALLIKMRVVGMTSSFAAGDWKFNNGSFTFNASNTTYNFSGICVGDVNGSYIPTGMKETSLLSVNDGIVDVPVNESFTYDIRSSQSAELGAMTLFMNYDQNRFEIDKVITSLDGLEYVVKDGQIALAWSDLKPLLINNNDPIISLQMKAKAIISEPTQIFTINSGSEFADANAVKLNNYTIKMASIATSVNGEKDLYITNYPNPFTSSTDIVYTLPEQSKVKLVLTNILGQTISTLVDGVQIAGSYKVVVSTSNLNLTPGVYTYRIDVEGATTSFSKTNKVICK